MFPQVKNIVQISTSDTILRCLSTKVPVYDYQYLQKSTIPTLHFQKSLPRLPIPELQDTCKRYLAAQKPILSPEEYAKTEKYVKNFQNIEGHILQKLLKAKDKMNRHTSYISEPWFDMYLSDRTSLPINYNPVMVFKNDEKASYNSQLLKSTNMLISSLRFLKSLRKNILEPEVFHLNPKKSNTDLFRKVTSLLPKSVSWYGAYMFNAYPLDMSQYPSLFNSTRIPVLNKDKLYQNSTAKHIVVMRNGYFYTFDVLDKDGNILPASVLLAALRHILEDTERQMTDVPLGVLTTENRDTWATVRSHIESIEDNKQLLNKIDSALFNLVLDEEIVGSNPTQLVKHFLHGNGKNRWFDKSFSLIISKDGVAGINFEHAWGDGVAVLRYLQDIYRDSTENPQVHPDTVANVGGTNIQIEKLGFKIDEETKLAVQKALNQYTSICNSLEIDYFLIEDFGKTHCKKYSISPDSLMQLGFQSAFYKQNKKFVASYESCSTAAFKHGRTETIRPCTMQTSLYCKKVHDDGIRNADDLIQLIKDCSINHTKLTKNAAMGQGFDRHLYALRLMAIENNINKMHLFEDPAFEAINKNIISTSTLSSPAIQAGGFGPVVPNGYGIAYMIMEDRLGSVITNYSAHRDGSDFIQCLKFSFEQLRDVFVKAH